MSLKQTHRKKCHNLLDPIWKKWKGADARSKAYILMAKLMGKTTEEAHISCFDVEECQELIRLIREGRFTEQAANQAMAEHFKPKWWRERIQAAIARRDARKRGRA